MALAAGIGSLGAGLVQAFTGEPSTTSLILTIIGPTVIALWMLVMGALLWRRASLAQPTPPRPLASRRCVARDLHLHARSHRNHRVDRRHRRRATRAAVRCLPRVTGDDGGLPRAGHRRPGTANDGATRLIFTVLAALGVGVVWCGLQARRVRPRDDDAGPSPRYFASIGFTLVALVDAFLVIAVLNLGAPGWALATTGVLIAGIGHIVLRGERRRLVPGTRDQAHRRDLT